MHLLRFDRYFRDAFIVSELVFVVNDFSRGFPSHAEQNTIWILYFSSQVHTWQSLVLSALLGLLEWSCPKITHCRETRQHALAFAVGDPIEELSWDLFDISDCFPAERKEWLLKWLQENVVSFMILKRCNKLCHTSRVKLPFVKNVCDLVFGFDILDLDFLGPGWFCQITSPEQLGGCGTHVSSPDFCLWWSSLSQLRCLRKCTTVILSQRDVRSKELDIRSIDPHSDPCLVFVFFGSFPALQWPNPTSQAQVNRPYANQHPTMISDSESCETPTIASCTSNYRYKCSTSINAQNSAWCWFWIFKITCKVWILKKPQSTMLSRISHMTILAEITREINLGKSSWKSSVTCLSPFCDRSCQFVDLTKECEVDQFVPGTSIPLQYGSKLQKNQLYFSILPFWWGDRPNRDEKLCIVAPSFCLPIRNTVPRIFKHVLPCRKTTLKFLREVCPILVISRLLQQKYGMQTSCCIVQ